MQLFAEITSNDARSKTNIDKNVLSKLYKRKLKVQYVKTNIHRTNCIPCINLLLGCSILLSLDLKFRSAGPKKYVDVFSMNRAAHTYLFFASV